MDTSRQGKGARDGGGLSKTSVELDAETRRLVDDGARGAQVSLSVARLLEGSEERRVGDIRLGELRTGLNNSRSRATDDTRKGLQVADDDRDRVGR